MSLVGFQQVRPTPLCDTHMPRGIAEAYLSLSKESPCACCACRARSPSTAAAEVLPLPPSGPQGREGSDALSPTVTNPSSWAPPARLFWRSPADAAIPATCSAHAHRAPAQHMHARLGCLCALGLVHAVMKPVHSVANTHACALTSASWHFAMLLVPGDVRWLPLLQLGLSISLSM